MYQFSKFVLFGSSAVAATYLVYRFLKSRSNAKVSVTNIADSELNSINEDDVLEDVVQKGGYEERINGNDSEAIEEEKEVRADGVLLWIEECVAEYYSSHPGPSCYAHIKQDILDRLMDSEVWDHRSSANVKSYVQDYLRKERHDPIQKASSEKESSAPPNESDEDSLDANAEIDRMCHNYFGVSREEYLALEEEAAKRMSEIMTDVTSPSPVFPQSDAENRYQVVNERKIRNRCCLEEKDDKIVKEPKKRWKKFRKRISKFFKRDKGSKSE